MKEDLFEILAKSKDINELIFSAMLEALRIEKITDCLGFLSKADNQ